jgi:hypothetical protein
MSDELVPAGAQTDVVGRAHMVDGELVVRVRPSGVRDVTARPVHRGDPDTLAGFGFMRYAGPALPRRERRQRRWLRWGTKRREAAR